jgi:polyisoprenoid-binding protein YceI
MPHLFWPTVVLGVALAGSAPAATRPSAQTLHSTPVKVGEGSVSFEVATNVFSTTVAGKSTALAGSTTVRETGAELQLEQVEATVPVTSLRTGIRLRDEHMRKYIFETGDGQLPDVTFSARNIRCSQASPNGYTCPTSGTLSIRGTSRPIDVELKVERNGDGFHVSGDTLVTLSSYGIERPSQFGVRTDDKVKIHVEFKASSAAATSARAR